MKTLVMGSLIVVLCVGLYNSTLYACEKCSSPDACDMESATGPQPVSCSLSPTEYSERVTEIRLIFAKRQEVRELDDGYAFHFPGDDVDLASRLTTLIVAERQCCSFFRFELTFASEQGPIWLSVRGSREVKAAVLSLMEPAATTTRR